MGDKPILSHLFNLMLQLDKSGAAWYSFSKHAALRSRLNLVSADAEPEVYEALEGLHEALEPDIEQDRQARTQQKVDVNSAVVDQILAGLPRNHANPLSSLNYRQLCAMIEARHVYSGPTVAQIRQMRAMRAGLPKDGSQGMIVKSVTRVGDKITVVYGHGLQKEYDANSPIALALAKTHEALLKRGVDLGTQEPDKDPQLPDAHSLASAHEPRANDPDMHEPDIPEHDHHEEHEHYIPEADERRDEPVSPPILGDHVSVLANWRRDVTSAEPTTPLTGEVNGKDVTIHPGDIQRSDLTESGLTFTLKDGTQIRLGAPAAPTEENPRPFAKDIVNDFHANRETGIKYTQGGLTVVGSAKLETEADRQVAKLRPVSTTGTVGKERGMYAESCKLVPGLGVFFAGRTDKGDLVERFMVGSSGEIDAELEQLASDFENSRAQTAPKAGVVEEDPSPAVPSSPDAQQPLSTTESPAPNAEEAVSSPPEPAQPVGIEEQPAAAEQFAAGSAEVQAAAEPEVASPDAREADATEAATPEAPAHSETPAETLSEGVDPAPIDVGASQEKKVSGRLEIIEDGDGRVLRFRLVKDGEVQGVVMPDEKNAAAFAKFMRDNPHEDIVIEGIAIGGMVEATRITHWSVVTKEPGLESPAVEGEAPKQTPAPSPEPAIDYEARLRRNKDLEISL